VQGAECTLLAGISHAYMRQSGEHKNAQVARRESSISKSLAGCAGGNHGYDTWKCSTALLADVLMTEAWMDIVTPSENTMCAWSHTRAANGCPLSRARRAQWRRPHKSPNWLWLSLDFLLLITAHTVRREQVHDATRWSLRSGAADGRSAMRA